MSDMYSNIIQFHDLKTDWKKSLINNLNGVITSDSNRNEVIFTEEFEDRKVHKGVKFSLLGTFGQVKWILVEYSKVVLVNRRITYVSRLDDTMKDLYYSFKLEHDDKGLLLEVMTKVSLLKEWSKAPSFNATTFDRSKIQFQMGKLKINPLEIGGKARKSGSLGSKALLIVQSENNQVQNQAIRYTREFIQSVRRIIDFQFQGIISINELENLENYDGLILLPVSGRVGDKLEGNSLKAWSHLRSSNLKWRLFSTTVDHGSFDWLPMLSGVMHVFKHPLYKLISYDARETDRVFVGIDLSHRHSNSVICFSVIFGTGMPIYHRKYKARKDESIDNRYYQDFLNRFCHWCSVNNLYCHEIVVLRDGRFFEKENVKLFGCLEEYCDRLFVTNLSKYQNPVFSPSEKLNFRIPTTAYIKINDHESFLLPANEDKGTVSHSTRLKVVYSNTKEENLDHLSKLLLEQSYTTRLGIKGSKYPSPIYWADGVASVKNGNLKFDGLPEVRQIQLPN